MAIFVGLAVALMLATFEIGIRTGWFSRMLSMARPRLELRTGWTPRVAREVRIRTVNGRGTSPGHT